MLAVDWHFDAGLFHGLLGLRVTAFLALFGAGRSGHRVAIDMVEHRHAEYDHHDNNKNDEKRLQNLVDGVGGLLVVIHLS